MGDLTRSCRPQNQRFMNGPSLATDASIQLAGARKYVDCKYERFDLSFGIAGID